MKSSPKKSKPPQSKSNPKKLAINGVVNKPARTSSATVLRDQLQKSYCLWGAVCLIVIAVLLAYSNSFRGPFIYDDSIVIVNNPTLHYLLTPNLPQDILARLSLGARHVIFSRPITNWTFALNYALGGLNPFGYHVFNVLMHACSSLLVFGIVRRTLLSKSLKERWGNHALLLSLAIALLWAVHPLQTNAINYITQRLESLAGFFYLATLYCLIRGSESKNATRWLSIGVLAAFLGMGSKETMVTAPVILLLYDRTFLASSFKAAIVKRPWFYCGLVLAWVFLCVLLGSGHSTGAEAAINGRGGISDTWSYAATQLGVVLHYLKLTIWPSPLIFDNYWPVANTVNAILWPGLVVAAMGGLTLWGFIKNRPWAMIGLWFFIILAPSSSFVPIMDEYVNEYRMYLPVLAPITLLVLGLYAGYQQALGRLPSGKTGGINKTTLALIFSLMIIIAFIALAATTYERNKDYASDVAIWSDVIKKVPNNARAHSNLGVGLLDSGLVEAAIREFKVAIELNPVVTSAHYNLGVVFYGQKQYENALAEHKKELAINPGDLNAKANIEDILNIQAAQASQAGNNLVAIEKLKEVLAINQNNAAAKKNLAILTGK